MRLILILAVMAFIAACSGSKPKAQAEPAQGASELPDQTEKILDFEEFPKTTGVIYFALGSSEVSKFYDASVLEWAEYMRHTGFVISVVGHACPLGSDDFNFSLAYARARSVRESLLYHGIPSWKITIESKGEQEPVTTDPVQYALNRRVEVSFQEFRQ